MTPKNGVETVAWNGETLAYLVQPLPKVAETTFLTPPDVPLQLGLVAYPSGESIPRHIHKPVKRDVQGTPEVIIVQQGSGTLEIYSPTGDLLKTKRFEGGDVFLFLAGGHGFVLDEDTVLFEIKQGPYLHDADKERF
jgi:oxalate decarboxylase/phosphoglucose isomerase-like protein (cupin superfamily)